MIRQATPEDTDAILEVWLLASLQAHDFIPAAFWWQQQEEMRARYLPAAQIWVCECHGGIQGFVALVDNYLAALFVRPEYQQKGIGKALLAMAKSQRRWLSLRVYCENDAAVSFYRRHGFVIIEESLDPATGQPELHMKYKVAAKNRDCCSLS
ncbi:N-acetyltransferase [Oceanisphaera psychrotolerans]|uniref:GNAT family N-acetyltransferase n=1 Tax=Oceanisphaera psychrotolerans TaxID=1414654 RepID=A0A1J4QB03_9GAMM|nr:N-acetyltransferase [Oceanisphaera psychrotolerans]OIN06523.1 GNAT family N-acetyltransferase [Oceanisphaera psychrotolerans]